MLPANEVIKVVAQLSAANPTQHTFNFAVYTPSGDDAWQVLIEQFPQPILGSDTALVVLDNQDDDGVAQILTVDGATCAIGSQFISANEGTRAEMTINRTVATTLLFRQDGDDIALWSEPSFWQLFGGSKITFTWAKN